MTRTGLRDAARAAALAWVLVWTGAADAQGPPDVGDVPAGEGTLLGTLVRGDGGGVAEHEVVLAAFHPDLGEGVRRTHTDAGGAFRFSGVTTDPDTAFFLLARVDGVHHTERTAFAAGETEKRLEIRVRETTSDASSLVRGTSFVRIDRGCDALQVIETHELANPGDAVVFVAPERRAGATPPLHLTLPDGAGALQTAFGALPDGLARDGDEARFWGPVYPGAQTVEYAYTLPLAEGELRWALPQAVPRIELLADRAGPVLGGPRLREVEGRTLDGRPYRVLAANDLPAGAELVARLALPPASEAPVALRSVQLWLELDDAALTVDGQLEMVAPEGAPLIARSDAPLLCVPLPEGATDLRFGRDALGMGPARDTGGDLALRGPIPPGRSVLATRFRLPLTDEQTGLAPSFDRELPLLSVFVADTGVRVETERLHRRRTVRRAERNFLHYEAFELAPGDTAALRLSRIDAPGAPSPVLRGGFLLAIGSAVLALLAGPLRGSSAQAARPDAAADLAAEREGVVSAIRALDEDFETGKLEPADHAALRAELRERAVALLRAERAGAAVPEPPAATPAGCVACGAALPDSARFCPQCGAAQQDDSPA